MEHELAKLNAEREALLPIIVDLHQYASAFADSPPLHEFDLGPFEADAGPPAIDSHVILTLSPSLHEVTFN